MDLKRILKNGAITGSVGAVTATLMGASAETFALITLAGAVAPAAIEGSIDLGKWSIAQWEKHKEQAKTFANNYLNPLNPDRNAEVTVGAVFAAGGAMGADLYAEPQSNNYGFGSSPAGASPATFKAAAAATAFTFGVVATQVVKRAWDASTGYLAAQAKKAHDALQAKNLEDAKRKAAETAQAAAAVTAEAGTDVSADLAAKAKKAAEDLEQLQRQSTLEAAADDTSSVSTSAKNLLSGLASRITGHSAKQDDKEKDKEKNKDKRKQKSH